MKPDWRDAALRGDARLLSEQLEVGAPVDALDRYGQTALMLTSLHGHADATRVLIDAGADLDHSAKYHLSALMLAAIHGHEEIARMLIEAGADTEVRGSGAPGFSRKTALELARDMKHDAIVALLIRAR